jgi:hypothetical protein
VARVEGELALKLELCCHGVRHLGVVNGEKKQIFVEVEKGNVNFLRDKKRHV